MRHALGRAMNLAPVLLAPTLALGACSSTSNSASPDASIADVASIDSTANDAATDETQACGSGAAIPAYVRSPGDTATFPADFLFGGASAGFQTETGLIHTDWYNWANVPGHVANGDKPDDGPDSLDHITDDIAAMKNAGITAYRFSIEWTRIFPTEAQLDAGTPDPAGVAIYHTLLQALHAAGIRPFVTLHHFATPDYLDDITQPTQPQSFERPEMQAEFVKWATFAGTEYGAEVDDWITINEPLVLLIGAYVGGGHPPGAPADVDRMVAAAKKLIRTHAAVYDALHAADTVDSGTGHAAYVSMAKHNRAFYPDDPCNPDDVISAQKTDYIWNQWIYNAVVFGNWDDDLDGSLDGPNDITGDPTLKGRVDWIGVNYYGDATLSSRVKLDYVGGIPNYVDLDDPLPKTDLQWDVFPQGLRPVLRELKQYGLPIYITENGIADGSAASTNKQRFMAEHLWEVGRAIEDDGLDIRGFFWWAVTDNFEWGNGFCPRFGLNKVDYTSPARTRSPYPVAAMYQTISTQKSVTSSMIDALPQYAAPSLCPSPD